MRVQRIPAGIESDQGPFIDSSFSTRAGPCSIQSKPNIPETPSIGPALSLVMTAPLGVLRFGRRRLLGVAHA